MPSSGPAGPQQGGLPLGAQHHAQLGVLLGASRCRSHLQKPSGRQKLTTEAPGRELAPDRTGFCRHLWWHPLMQRCPACRPAHNNVRLLFTIIFGLVLGAMYWRVGSYRQALQPR